MSADFFADYEQLEKLGQGHYAEVFKCKNKATGELFAVKIIDKKKTTTKQQQGLLGEVAILKEIDHKNCLKLCGFYDQGDKVFVVLELITGGELFQRICKERHFSEKTAAKMIKEILEGVAYLHERGIIHRDLKPENLIAISDADDAPIKLVDFGFAEKCGVGQESLTKCCGTPLYIAPEVLRAGLYKTGPPYGVGADMWSIGVILYILLCGYPPFRAKTQSDQFKKVCEAKLEFPANKMWGSISEEAKNLIAKMICVDTKARITAKDALQHEWLRTNVDVSLAETQEVLRDFNAQQTWRRGIFGVEAVNRILYLKRCTAMNIKPNTAIDKMLLEAQEAVTTIDLSANYVGPNGLLALLDVVENNHNIEALVLGNNGATNAVVERLCVVARTHPRLRSINLDRNPVSHLAGRMLLHTLQINNRLTSLSLEGTVLQPQMLARIALQLHRNQQKQAAAARQSIPPPAAADAAKKA